MRDRHPADTATDDTEPDSTRVHVTPRLSSLRLLTYAVVAFWAGSESEANWTAVLDGRWVGVTITGAVLAGCLAVLALMWRWDRRHERLGDDDEFDMTEDQLDTLMERAEPVELVDPPSGTWATGTTQTWHWDSTSGFRRLS